MRGAKAGLQRQRKRPSSAHPPTAVRGGSPRRGDRGRPWADGIFGAADAAHPNATHAYPA
eukprot:893128-Alexandrium_andersonii.AAC.1